MEPSANRDRYATEAFGRPLFTAELEEVARNQPGTLKNLAAPLPLERLPEPDKYLRYDPGVGRYFDRGFAPTPNLLSPNGSHDPPPLTREPDPGALECLDRLMRLCGENGIRVIWVSSPYPIDSPIKQGHCEEEYQLIRRLAEQYGVPYWNFNLAKRDALPLEIADFADYRHLNLGGANKLTALVCELIAADREGRDASFAFCASFAERAQAEN